MNKDLYNILGVDENADDVTIKKAYHKLSMKTHPDTPGGGDEEKFKEISGAYEVLRDRGKRQEYDMKRNNQMFGEGIPIPPELFDILSGGMGGMGGISFMGGPMGGVEQLFGGAGPQIFHMSSNMHNPFMQSRGKTTRKGPNMSNIMGNRMREDGQKKFKIPPIEKNLEISLEEAFSGKTKQISLTRTVISGMTRTLEKETLYVTIPKGVDTDEIIVIENKGNVHNDHHGDVKIIVKVKNFTKFERRGLDLIYTKEISLKEALCGFTFDMEYIDGKVFKINNNEGNIISDGYEKNIPDMGLRRDNISGILTIRFKVIYPKTLTLENIQKIKEIL